MFDICMELAASLEKEHHDNWHPLVWLLARSLKQEAEELAWEKARAKIR